MVDGFGTVCISIDLLGRAVRRVAGRGGGGKDVRLSVGRRGGGGSCGGWGGTLKCFWLAAAVGSGGRQTCNLAVQLNQHYLHVSDR